MDNEAEQLFIRIYTDEHITALLAPALRRRGYVAQSCVEANALGWDDEEHLVYATERDMAFRLPTRRILYLWPNAGMPANKNTLASSLPLNSAVGKWGYCCVGPCGFLTAC